MHILLDLLKAFDPHTHTQLKPQTTPWLGAAFTSTLISRPMRHLFRALVKVTLLPLTSHSPPPLLSSKLERQLKQC